MKNSTMTKILCTAVFGVAASMSGMTYADSYHETVVSTSAKGLRTATVSFADLDLSGAKGRTTLHYRIKSAARQVCGSAYRSHAGSLAQASKNRRCYNGAMDDAMRSLSAGKVALVSR